MRTRKKMYWGSKGSILMQWRTINVKRDNSINISRESTAHYTGASTRQALSSMARRSSSTALYCSPTKGIIVQEEKEEDNRSSNEKWTKIKVENQITVWHNQKRMKEIDEHTARYWAFLNKQIGRIEYFVASIIILFYLLLFYFIYYYFILFYLLLFYFISYYSILFVILFIYIIIIIIIILELLFILCVCCLVRSLVSTFYNIILIDSNPYIYTYQFSRSKKANTDSCSHIFLLSQRVTINTTFKKLW